MNLRLHQRRKKKASGFVVHTAAKVFGSRGRDIFDIPLAPIDAQNVAASQNYVLRGSTKL
ncbi:MAG: hypothetical protein MI861_04465 [Pirellulales bacterium]|nr:hypothetical protein [Pirellulales bacterium]